MRHGGCVEFYVSLVYHYDDKTDLLVLTARHRPQPPIEKIAVGSDLIYPSETVKNLGTVFDTTLSLEKQVTAVCKAGFYHLRNIAHIRNHLSFESNQVLISRLRYLKIGLL